MSDGRVVARAVAVRRHPELLAGVEVDGRDALVGRLHQRQAPRPGHRRGPGIGEVADGGRRRVLDQLDRPQPRLRRDEEPPRLRIDGRAGPVDAAAGSGRLDDRLALAADRGRREDRTELGPGGDADRLLPELRREVHQVVDRDSLQVEGRRPGREGLRRRVPLPRHAAGGHGPLLDRPDRFARHAVEDVGEGLLARLRDGLDLAAVDGDVQQVAGGREVVVPQAVVHGLEVPDPLAGLGVDADDALREQVVAGAHAAVPVVRWGPGGQVDVAQLLVHRHRAPHVGVAAVAPRLVVPGVGAELLPLRDGVEDPLPLARADVEAAHVSGVRLAARQARVLHDAPDDHRVAGDGERLGVREAGAIDRPPQRGAQIHGAVGAEVRVLLARPRVEGHEQQVVGGDEDARVVARVVLPVGDAAVLPAHVGGPVQPVVGLRVVGPDQLAGPGVERRDLPERRAQVDQPSDHQRHRLERAGPDLLAHPRDVGLDRPPAPGDLQVGEVVGRDLVQRGVLRVRSVAAEVPPFDFGRRLRRRSRGGLRRSTRCRERERDRQGDGARSRRRDRPHGPARHRAASASCRSRLR